MLEHLARRGAVAIFAALAVALIVLVTTAGFYTDWLWFGALGVQSVLLTTLGWEWALRLSGALVTALFFYWNVRLTRESIGQALFRLQEHVPGNVTWRTVRWVMVLASLFVGLVVGSGLGESWLTIARSLHATPFGTVDPLFGRDASFYMLQLPVWEMLYSLGMSILFLSALAVVVIYAVTGNIRFESGLLPQLSGRAHSHVSLLIAALLGLRSWGYSLQMYGLLLSGSGVVFGAGYVDANVLIPAYRVMAILTLVANVLIPAYRVMAILTLVAAVGLVLSRFRSAVRLLWGALGAWVVASILGTGVIPGLVQRFVVEPNELAMEEPYIEYSIELTRSAYGLDQVEERDFVQSDAPLDPAVAEANEAVFKNIRLWDWDPLLSSYQQLQGFRLYYDFVDIDIDRYVVDGELRQVMLSGREMNVARVQNRTWTNEKLQYTHGYGVVVSPVNEVSPQGQPTFLLSNIPPEGNEALRLDRPEIYYGQLTNTDVFVNTDTPEFDYPQGDQNASTFYEGTGGVSIGSLWRKAAFALRTSDSRILLSRQLNSDSRILFRRNIQERVRTIAPFLHYDEDPYLVVADGRLFWMWDAYTTSNRFPYSEMFSAWGNYVRNSVKIVVDAYNGSVTFYVWDEEDPVLHAIQGVFPDLFTPISEMPSALREHVRYPADLFLIQAAAYAQYHVDDPRVFYNQEDLWNFPYETRGVNEQVMEPYYVVSQLPGDEEPSFLLVLPFTPNQRNNMVGWLAARSDPDRYGELILYQFSKQELTYGPRQIESRINQNGDISQLITLWSQRDSTVLRGNMMVLPIEGHVVYVEPLFLEARTSQLPELRRVILVADNRLVLAETLDAAVELLTAGVGVEQIDEYAAPSGAVGTEGTPQSPPRAMVIVGEEAEQALQAYRDAQEAVGAGDWTAYGEALDRLEGILEQMVDQQTVPGVGAAGPAN